MINRAWNVASHLGNTPFTFCIADVSEKRPYLIV